jgi:hypothetical protein
MRQGHRHTPNNEWGRKNRKEEDRLRGLNGKADREAIDEGLLYVYCDVCGFDWTTEDPCPYH